MAAVLTGAAVVLTAALATPQQAGARSPAASQPDLADDSSSSAPAQQLKPQPEYWDLVRRFEPWVLDDPDLPDEVRQGRPASGSSAAQPPPHHFHPDLPVISYQ